VPEGQRAGTPAPQIRQGRNSATCCAATWPSTPPPRAPGVRQNTELEDSLEYDPYYIKNISISPDVYIFFHTVKTMLLSRGAQ
jgi:hypothetical protein